MKPAQVVIQIAVTAAFAAASSALAADTTASEDAIRKQAQEFVNAFDQANAEAVADQWTTDGEYTDGHRSIKGRPAIAKLYEEFLRAHPGAKMEVRIESIRVLAPTVAIEQGTATVRSDSGLQPASSAYTAVHVKQGDKWLMANVRESEIASPVRETSLIDLAWLIGDWSAGGGTRKFDVRYSWMANKHFIRGETTVATAAGPMSAGVQIIGSDPETGRIVSWFFDADGGSGSGEWMKAGPRWLINARGLTADGVRTTSTNVLYHADDNVLSWQSTNRQIGGARLPEAKEIVIERVAESSAKK